MLRLRFSSGLILGLVIGLLAGVVIGMLMLPGHGPDAAGATNARVIELSRKLEAATEAKERTDRQLEQFQKLADQMTATFKSLEQRFNLLEEAQRLHEPQHPGQPDVKAPPPEPTAPPAPTATSASTPTAPATSAPDASTNPG